MISATPSATLPSTSFVGIEARLLRQEADGNPVGWKRLADELGVFARHDASSELLPAPFKPRTPIFAPGRNESQMSLRTTASGGWTFPSPFIV